MAGIDCTIGDGIVGALGSPSGRGLLSLTRALHLGVLGLSFAFLDSHFSRSPHERDHFL